MSQFALSIPVLIAALPQPPVCAVAYRIGVEFATWIALVRCLLFFLVGLKQMFRVHGRAQTSKWGWVERCTLPEPFILFITTCVLYTIFNLSWKEPLALSSQTIIFGLSGGAVSVIGLAIWAWSFVSFPKVAAGHYVEYEQRLVTAGAYGFVRHPIYLGIIMMWVGVAIAHTSVTVLLATFLYVVPIYVLYVRAEESMMRAEFGEEYDSYCKRVGGLLPRLRFSSNAK